eukprot:6435326-Amphidinium_carterae.1
MEEVPTAPAQRQRVNQAGDYNTRQHAEEEHPTRWHRGANQGYWSYWNLERQRNTATQQAEWHQHPLWRICGPCLEQYDNQFWIWNRCCSRCATFVCSSHATELVSPAYQRKREGGHELEESFYCGSTSQLFCPQCLEMTLRTIGAQAHLRHEQRPKTQEIAANVIRANATDTVKTDVHPLTPMSRACESNVQVLYLSSHLTQVRLVPYSTCNLNLIVILACLLNVHNQTAHTDVSHDHGLLTYQVCLSEAELSRTSEEQEAWNERARRQLLDRSLRDARPSPPATPPRPAGEVATANDDSTGHTGSLPDAPVQTSAVSHVEAVVPEPVMPTAPSTAASAAQDTGSNVEEVQFRRNKERGLSTGESRGSSSEIFPSPRTHMQPPPEHIADQYQNMEGNTGNTTEEPPTGEDESSKRPKTEAGWFEHNQRVSKEWNQRQEEMERERAERQAAEHEKRLPDKMPVNRNTRVIADDTASQSHRSLSADTGGGSGSGARFYCPCCPGWFFTPQKRYLRPYLHLAMQHTVLLPQLGGKMQDGFEAESLYRYIYIYIKLYVIPLLRPQTIRGGPREFAGQREATAYKSAIRNANKIEALADRCKLWTGGQVPKHWDVPQHMDVPDTDPADLQLAEVFGDESIKLSIENRDLYSARRADHGKMNSWARYQESKMEWGDRSAGGDGDQPDPQDRRYWASQPYQSPFGKGDNEPHVSISKGDIKSSAKHILTHVHKALTRL